MEIDAWQVYYALEKKKWKTLISENYFSKKFQDFNKNNPPYIP